MYLVYENLSNLFYYYFWEERAVPIFNLMCNSWGNGQEIDRKIEKTLWLLEMTDCSKRRYWIERCKRVARMGRSWWCEEMKGKKWGNERGEGKEMGSLSWRFKGGGVLYEIKMKLSRNWKWTMLCRWNFYTYRENRASSQPLLSSCRQQGRSEFK